MITKETIIDKIEIVGEFKNVHYTTVTIITENGVEISRSGHKKGMDSSADVSSEPKEVKDICNLVWTAAVKSRLTAYKSALL